MILGLEEFLLPIWFQLSGFFGAGTMEDQLREMSSRFRAWARIHQFPLLELDLL